MYVYTGYVEKPNGVACSCRRGAGKFMTAIPEAGRRYGTCRPTYCLHGTPSHAGVRTAASRYRRGGCVSHAPTAPVTNYAVQHRRLYLNSVVNPSPGISPSPGEEVVFHLFHCTPLTLRTKACYTNEFRRLVLSG